MNKEMSLDVALDIIGTLRMMKIDELSKETDPIKMALIYKRTPKIKSIVDYN